MNPCIHLDYEPKYSACELCTAVPHFPSVKYWKRISPPYVGAPVNVQFCKQRGRINDIFSCYNGERPCYEPIKDGAADIKEVGEQPTTAALCSEEHSKATS